jgi:hypothetical protein
VSAECMTAARKSRLRTNVVVVVSAASISVTLLLPANYAYADPTSTCPDGHMLLPTQIGNGNDKNNNGLVCGKIGDDGKVHGGPDDGTDDIIVT